MKKKFLLSFILSFICFVLMFAGLNKMGLFNQVSTVTSGEEETKGKDIDLGEIAKVFGGGGHPKASGSQFNTNVIKANILQNIFCGKNQHE